MNPFLLRQFLFRPKCSQSAAVAGLILSLPAAMAAPISASSYFYGADAESQPQPTSFQSGLISDVGNLKLIDGTFATGSWNDGTNVGFRNDTDNGNPQPRVTFDLGTVQSVSTINIWTVSAFLGSNESVSISSSKDGTAFSAPVVANPIVWTGGFPNSNLRQGVIDVSPLPSGQFYRVEVFDTGQWMMINEITFDGTSDGADITPPTISSSNIVDDQSGEMVVVNTLVTYTVTFSEDMDHTTVDAASFGNAGSSNITIGPISETSPGVFIVPVTPTTSGTLQLQVSQGAVVKDAAGNNLNTTSSIEDDTSISVTMGGGDTTPPTLAASYIVDDQSGGTVNANSLVTYTLTFSEDMDHATVDVADFGNAGSSNIVVGTIIETSPGIFSVEITPTSAGTLRLEIVSGAVLTDSSGNSLATDSAITDETSITVNAPSSGNLAVTSYVYGSNPESQPQPTSFQGGSISDVGNLKLTDGSVATGSWNDRTNVGFRNDSDNGAPQPQVTFYLGALYDVETVNIWTVSSFLGSESVSISSSIDGINYGPPIVMDPLVWTGGFSNTELQQASVDVSSLPDGWYFRLEFFDPGQWMMINEIQFVGSPGGPDLTPPTLAGGGIVDDRSGGTVNENTLVTFTVSFSEDIDAATISAVDFGNAGTSTISFGAITEIAPGVFTVAVTPTNAGSLQFQVLAGSSILDPAGNPLDTGSAIVDDTSLNVVVAPPDNTPPTPSPMTFASAPSASSETSITMLATTANDLAGVEYFFTETSGNPGGNDSGWQGSPAYEDTGLTTGLLYTYTVMARDLSSNQNATAPSASASATAQTPIIPPVITAPTSRHIVQRSSTNVGAIEIAGTYGIGNPDVIEARAAVMPGGGNSGSTTAWQSIDASPTGGNFSGTLIDVPAGGWYQIEVRSVIGGSPSNSAVMEKIGVGDIFVTAGQSNSANHSPGGYVPTDDRVSARNSVSGSTWVLARDSIPIASGGGGSVWPRLGDQLAATLNIPIGFIAVGVGGSQVASWVPGAGNYNNRLKPAVQSLPTNGFRAGLWHQGESDSIGGVSATTHANRLGSMMSQSRIDAGWNIPWYICEASWHGGSIHANQEGVAAGQRLAIHGDPHAFLGETTDDMHLKGSPLHFDIPRQLERSQQYTDILAGTPEFAAVNGDFEDNRTPSVTSLSPLADGASVVVILTGSNEPRPIGWRMLSTSGLTAADGANGFHNPTTGTYAGAVDSINGGMLPNMDGKHVALLDGGTPGNYFLHSTRALATVETTYTLTVALGVRDNAISFGNARLEITANGEVVASGLFDKAALDTLHGSDASGTFTDASISWSTGDTVAANQPLAVRIVKEGGTGTVLDFDNVRLTATAIPMNDFDSWINGFGLDPAEKGFGDDPDSDGIASGVEAWLGTNPGQFSGGFADLSTNGTSTTFTHPRNLSPPIDINGFYQWSPNLNDWYPSGFGPVGGSTVTFTSVMIGNSTTVTATASEAIERFFIRAGAILN